MNTKIVRLPFKVAEKLRRIKWDDIEVNRFENLIDEFVTEHNERKILGIITNEELRTDIRIKEMFMTLWKKKNTEERVNFIVMFCEEIVKTKPIDLSKACNELSKILLPMNVMSYSTLTNHCPITYKDKIHSKIKKGKTVEIKVNHKEEINKPVKNETNNVKLVKRQAI